MSQAIHVVATLGIADRLADGARTSDELATATDTHPDALYRLLRALAGAGVLREEDGRRFTLTELGDRLRSDAPESLRSWAVYSGRPYRWEAWTHLLDSVRTGESAFRHAHGEDVWEYWDRRPEEGAVFDRAMTEGALATNRSLLDAYDFGRFGTVIDVGGGEGAFLAALLAEHPGVRGVLFDLARVVGGAEARFGSAGVMDRCTVVAGSFFDDVPEGGDAYVLQSVLHDWDDAEAAAILRSCRRAAPHGAALLVLERELGPPNDNPRAKLGDLNMLVGPGGRERTVDDYGALLEAAGFRLCGNTPSRSGVHVIDAVAD